MLNYGLDGFLAKPVSPSVLYNTVIDVIGARDRVTVEGWFDTSSDKTIDTIEAGDEYTLVQKDVAKLVEVMAGFAAPASGATRLTTHQKEQVASYFAGPSAGS